MIRGLSKWLFHPSIKIICTPKTGCSIHCRFGLLLVVYFAATFPKSDQCHSHRGFFAQSPAPSSHQRKITQSIKLPKLNIPEPSILHLFDCVPMLMFLLFVLLAVMALFRLRLPKTIFKLRSYVFLSIHYQSPLTNPPFFSCHVVTACTSFKLCISQCHAPNFKYSCSQMHLLFEYAA